MGNTCCSAEVHMNMVITHGWFEGMESGGSVVHQLVHIVWLLSYILHMTMIIIS
jgi:hypothetical protein